MPIKLKKNERSWAIQIIQKISQYVHDKEDCVIKLAGGETTINTGTERMFPDVLLFADTGQSLILQGWELKMPDVPITDSDFVQDAWRKAENLNLNSCVIWNFRYGVFYVKNSESGEFEKAEEWDNSAFISEDRNDVELQINKWLSVIYSIIDEVNKYFSLGKFIAVKKSNVFVNKISENFIRQNKDILGSHYKKLSVDNAKFASFIDLWWDGAKAEYVNDEKEPCTAYAKVILLDWMNKLFFANFLKAYYPAPNEVVKIKDCPTPEDALKIFDGITVKCDFYSIFHRSDYEAELPNIVWDQLQEISEFLSQTTVGKIEQNDMRSLLENVVKASQRIIIGQYTTPPVLAAFMVRSAINSAHDYCFDPCCGTGTFIREILSYKAEKGLSAKKQYSTVFAEDRQRFPLQIAGLSSVSNDSIKIPSIVYQGNIFEQKIGNKISIVNPADGTPEILTLPEFDFVVSNLPFIDFCRNNTHNIDDERSKAMIKEEVLKNTGVQLSKRSDYYMYIIFHIWKMLKTEGRACVVTSNSWLGTETGNIFLCALSHYYSVKGVVISGGKRWFNQASVVTTVWILEKKEIHEAGLNEKINFYLLNTELENLKTREVMNKAVGTILQDKEIDKDIMQVNSYSWSNLQFFSKLNLSFNVCFHEAAWLYQVKEKIFPLTSLFEVIRGIKTGQDEIFFPKDKSAVDSVYIDSILHDSKTCQSLVASPDDFFINCPVSYSELKRLKHTKTINYFKQFEGKLNQSVLSHGEIWWELKETKKKPVIITGMNPNERLFFSRFDKPSCINQRLIGFTPVNSEIDVGLCHALLNSVLQLFFLESVGFGKGEGALDTSKDNIEKLFMFNPSILSEKQKTGILRKFEPLKQRKILTTTREMQQDDRIAFDHCILSAYGIDNLYVAIRDTLLKMQKRRLSV